MLERLKLAPEPKIHAAVLKWQILGWTTEKGYFFFFTFTPGLLDVTFEGDTEGPHGGSLS